MNKNNIELFLKSNNLKKFQLVVFDRVLYCFLKMKLIMFCQIYYLEQKKYILMIFKLRRKDI